MNIQFKDVLLPFLLTIVGLFIVEVFSTAFLPLLGIENFRISIIILLVLYFGFRLEVPFLAVMIFIIQYCHSFFSLEGWAISTFSGVLVCMIIGYLKDLLHFPSIIATMLVTQIFQTLWFFISSLLLYLKLGNWQYIFNKFWHFLPESIIISLLAPFIFLLLDKIWKVGHDSVLEGQA